MQSLDWSKKSEQTIYNNLGIDLFEPVDGPLSPPQTYRIKDYDTHFYPLDILTAKSKIN